MTCPEFDRLWQERLDARGAPASAQAAALDQHAAACPTCRDTAAGYHALEQALAAGPVRVPVLPSGFADRVVAEFEMPVAPAPVWALRARRFAPLAAAAAVAVAVGLGVLTRAPVRPEPRPVAVTDPGVRAIDPADLTAALARVTTATWDLARDASAPAARVGGEVLADAELPAAPDPLALPGAVVPDATEVLQEVGQSVNAGVRPFSGTARRAFSFLALPAAGPPPPPAGRPPRGA